MRAQVAEPEGARRRFPRAIAAAALLIAAAGALWYALSGSLPGPTTARSRTAFDFIVTWRCLECGATREDAASIGPHRCEKCGRDESYASIQYACPAHGAMPVAFQYDERGRPTQIRIAGADWVPYADADGNLNTRCPKCRTVMNPAERMRPRRRIEAP